MPTPLKNKLNCLKLEQGIKIINSSGKKNQRKLAGSSTVPHKVSI